jgi:Mg-chelatase subunit ChlD
MKLLYTLIFSFFSLLAFADGMHITGIIRDMDTKEPVKSANITLSISDGYEFSVVTDSSGAYNILTTAVVPDGYYTIKVASKNYYELNGFIFVKKECQRDFSIKAKEMPKPVLEGFATNNLVFLIDVSASMNADDKMPLLKDALTYLVGELRPTDRIAILTFSSTVKEILPSTAASDNEKIRKTIEALTFGSTTEGSAALDKAYKTALSNFVSNGNNRIILASDGLFTSGDKEYKRMLQSIAAGRSKNISLSIFCFGKNTEYVFTKLRALSQTGNGNFASILNTDEGKQLMIEEAKAVKN